jgi:hypothetical protein
MWVIKTSIIVAQLANRKWEDPAVVVGRQHLRRVRLHDCEGEVLPSHFDKLHVARAAHASEQATHASK